MPSPYVNPLDPELKEALDQLWSGDQAVAILKLEAVLVGWDHYVAYYQTVLDRDSDQSRVGQLLAQIEELKVGFEQACPQRAASAAFKSTRLIGQLKAVEEVNRLSQDDRLNRVLFLGRALLGGTPCQAKLAIALNSCSQAWSQWTSLWEHYKDAVTDDMAVALDRGFRSLAVGLEQAMSCFEANGLLETDSFRSALADIHNGALIIDPLLQWQVNRLEQAKNVPKVGRQLLTDIKLLQKGEGLPSARLDEWAETLLPDFLDWWDTQVNSLLLPDELKATLVEEVDSLFCELENEINEETLNLDFFTRWNDLFQAAAELRMPCETWKSTFWGSLFLSVHQNGVPDFVLIDTVQELQDNPSETNRQYEVALTDYLQSGCLERVSQVLESLTTEGRDGESHFTKFYLC